MTAAIIRADARHLPLPDRSVDLIVTSPPYWKRRDYRDTGSSLIGQIGAEPTPTEYIAALLDCTREWVRVLKPSGSLWVNLGDRYHGGGLLNLPGRYAIACTDALGLRQRAEVIWSKPNPFIDAKARDRARRTHEHLFHFAAAGARLYCNPDAIRITPSTDYRDRPQYRRAMELFTHAGFGDEHMAAVRAVGIIDTQGGRDRSGGSWTSESGRLARDVHAVLRSYYRELCGSNTAPLGNMPGSVWEVAAYPFKAPACLRVEHTASFPPALISRPIVGWSPPGGLVLDPLGGTGTTALVASALGRRGISVDLSHDYGRLAQWRTADPRQRARAVNRSTP